MILTMHRAFRILMGILIFLLLVAGGGVLLRNRLTAAVVVHVLEARTGCSVRIHGLSQGWGSFEMVIDELEVGNPPGFPAGRALLLRATCLRWSPRALCRGRLHLDSLQTDLAVVERVQSAAGAINLDPLSGAVKTALDRGELRMDRLILSLGEVRCVNEAKPDHEPLVVHGRGEKHIFEHLESSVDFDRVVRAMLTEELPSNLPGILGTTFDNAWKDFRKLF